MAIKPFLRHLLGSIADGFFTSRVFRWTWSAPEKASIKHHILELRPADAQTITDMMLGQYLLAQRLVDTGGASPFAVAHASTQWHEELHSFSWLRHFSAALDEGAKKFAGTLILDWMSRYSGFSAQVWGNKVTALRVLNWIKHFDLMCYGLSETRREAVERCLIVQVQNLRIRLKFEADPATRLLMRLALLGSAFVLQKSKSDIEDILNRTLLCLERQIDENGLHKSRNIELQFLLLMEMIPVRHAITPVAPKRGEKFAQVLEKMHHSLAMMMHTTGEVALFNNTRPVPHELLLAVQSRASGNLELESGKLSGGYGVLLGRDNKLLVDSGATFGGDFPHHIFAGGASFEFSARNDLIVTNCGPAPSALADEAKLFRLPATHSSLEIEYQGAFPHKTPRLLSQHCAANANSVLKYDRGDQRLDVHNRGYLKLAGVDHHRSFNILSGEGGALLGQDRIVCDMGHKNAPDEFLLRFHLGPGVRAQLDDAQSQIKLDLRSGALWVFIWEGAEALIEDSVRYSAYKELESIQQIVLRIGARPKSEIVWTFAPTA